MQFRTTLTTLLCALALYAQSQSPVNILYETDAKNDIIFFCEYNGWGHCTVLVSFTQLIGGRADVSLPHYATISSGRTRLFTIKRDQFNVSPQFSYGYSYAFGCLKVKPDTSVQYLLPIAPGKTTIASPLSYIGEKYGDETTPKHFNAMMFSTEQRDTIFAARRGTVISTRKGTVLKGNNLMYNTNDNYINIEHEDCSIGHYSVFTDVFVEAGSQIEAGSPIGTAGGDAYTSGPHVQLSVSYPDLKEVLDRKSNVRRTYFPITFWSKEGRVNTFIPGGTYTSDHPETLITKEMSKKEIKKYKSAKN
jgi:Peptidase family M23